MKNINKISPQDSIYTKGLIHIAKPPKTLYYIGKLPDTKTPTVAIVGTRKPSSYGINVARSLAYNLAKRGVIIISGLAFGIDSIAHKGALEAGGTTIAVLANGLDKIYPAAHTALAKDIVKNNGCIISESPENTVIKPYFFLARNRLISGLSDVTIVVEAAVRSGSLSTARHALEQGKEVFAVPGNINSSNSEGCNKLIREGAGVALSYQDILNVIRPVQNSKHIAMPKTVPLTDSQKQIIKHLKVSPLNIDDLTVKLERSTPQILSDLSMLEVYGLIESLNEKWHIIQ